MIVHSGLARFVNRSGARSTNCSRCCGLASGIPPSTRQIADPWKRCWNSIRQPAVSSRLEPLKHDGVPLPVVGGRLVPVAPNRAGVRRLFRVSAAGFEIDASDGGSYTPAAYTPAAYTLAAYTLAGIFGFPIVASHAMQTPINRGIWEASGRLVSTIFNAGGVSVDDHRGGTNAT
jgi:hypothetical protein